MKRLRLSNIKTILAKESLDSLRDIRSVIISFVIPLFLFPTIVLLLSSVEGEKQYNVSYNDVDQDIITYLDDDERLNHVNSDGYESDLLQHRIDAYITQYNKATFKALEINFDNSSRKSLEVYEYLKAKLTAFRLEQSMEKNVIGPDDFAVVFMPAHEINEGATRFLLFSVLPMLLFVIAVTSPLAVAADLFAGEKERKTLELILTTQANRYEITTGKVITVFIFGFIGTLCFLGGIYLSTFINIEVFGLTKLIISTNQICSLLLLLILLTLLTAAIESLISIIARTTKEAQLYIIPLSITFLTLNMISEKLYYLSNPGLQKIIPFFPVINIAHLIRKIIMVEFTTVELIITILTNTIAIVAFVTVASKLLDREKIIYR